MPTIPQRIAGAFAVFRGRYGDVTKMADDRERSRQSLYREAEQVADSVADGHTSVQRLRIQASQAKITPVDESAKFNA